MVRCHERAERVVAWERNRNINVSAVQIACVYYRGENTARAGLMKNYMRASIVGETGSWAPNRPPSFLGTICIRTERGRNGIELRVCVIMGYICIFITRGTYTA